jgi:hypothetical protein
MANESLFTESEIADLVRRAAELQEQGSKEGYVPGVTRDELVRMAQEAGIDPAFMLKAIEEKRNPPAGAPAPKGKFQWKTEVERVLPVEVSPDNYDIITDQVKVVPSMTSQNGMTSGGLTILGRTIQGAISTAWDNPAFKITSRGGRTSLKVSSTLSSACIGILAILPLMVSAVLAKEQGAIPGIVMALASVLGGWFTARFFASKAVQEASVVADKLEEGIMRAARETEALRERLDAPPSATSEENLESKV